MTHSKPTTELQLFVVMCYSLSPPLCILPELQGRPEGGSAKCSEQHQPSDRALACSHMALLLLLLRAAVFKFIFALVDHSLIHPTKSQRGKLSCNGDHMESYGVVVLQCRCESSVRELLPSPWGETSLTQLLGPWKPVISDFRPCV